MMTRYMTITPSLVVSQTPYAAGDVVGGLLTLEIATPTGGGLLEQVLLVDDDNNKVGMTLYLFREMPTVIADNAVFAPTAEDLRKLMCVVTLAGYTTLNLNAYVMVTNIGQSFVTGVGRLYGYLVTSSAVTYTSAADLSLRLLILGE